MSMDFYKLEAKHIMQSDLIVASPEMEVYELARMLQSKHITGVPVVDQDARLVGVVSVTDIVKNNVFSDGRILEELWENDAGVESAYKNLPEASAQALRVSSIMTPPVVTARENFSVSEISKIMVQERVHRVLILNAAGQLSGIVSTMDIVRLVYEGSLKEEGKRTAQSSDRLSA